MPSTTSQLLRTWLKYSAARRFDDATRYPRESQEHKLMQIVERNRDSVYGRLHDFARIRGVEDFQALVPPVTYSDVEPYAQRAMDGEKGVLSADDPLMFATTSGTTGRSKYIPVTPSYLSEYGHGLHVHTCRMFTDHPDILEGKILVSSSSDVEGHTSCGLPYGAISGLLARRQPAAIRRFYALPRELSAVKDVQAKYYLTLRHGLAADVRLLVTPNPSSMLLLADKMTAFAEELIHDIRTGTVNPAFVPDGADAGVTNGLLPDSERADMLARVLRRSRRLSPVDAWPNLRLVSCWKGGTMPLYLRKFPEHFGDIPIRDLGYMASEGRGATPLVDSGAGGVLNVSSHFFEFVPIEEHDSADPTFLTCEQLEPQAEYYVYLTTSAGLYRYDINDIVRVVDFYRWTPVIEFVRKGGGITSITGEKLTESQVTDALIDVVDANGFDVRHFTMRVQWGDPPAYAMYAELGESMTPQRSREFVREMDRALSRGNCEYECKRDSGRIGPPVLRHVADGSYQALRQARVAEGAPEAQVKIPQLSTSMDFGLQLEVLDEIHADLARSTP